ncbi:MAG TPA: hypothetical protein VNI02_20040 [Blastocatellia bacterium]|jgi:hypothetical protein|nr:hypothetical protein [Blastocatellia bacterium]
MSRNKKSSQKNGSRQADKRGSRKPVLWAAGLVAVLALGGIIAFVATRDSGRAKSTSASQPAQPAPAASNTSGAQTANPSQPATTSPPNDPNKEPQTLTMDVNTAVMVTEELDFGPHVPSIAGALQQIERRYKPDDGRDRTFAVLDAYGEPTPDGKLLHISMHVSAEKPGLGELVFKRTGQVIWRSRIQATSALPKAKNLTVLIDSGNGKTLTVDGSNNPGSILDATVKELGVPVQAVWPEGVEREVTFIYSACGCPVKVKVKRVGNKTARTSDLPVIFPDDPQAVSVISRLMRW